MRCYYFSQHLSCSVTVAGLPAIKREDKLPGILYIGIQRLNKSERFLLAIKVEGRAILYEIFWCLLIFLIFLKAKPGTIAVSVFSITCILEFLQLWHPPFLEELRSVFIGKTLLGTTFAWSDFPHYAAGCGIAWIWMRELNRIEDTIPAGIASQ